MMLRSPAVSARRPLARWRSAAVVAAGIVAVAVATAPVATAAPATPIDWLQFGGDAAHSGANAAEPQLSAASVPRLVLAFRTHLPGTADAPPVLLAGVATPSGIRDLLFVETMDGWTVALDAHSGAQLWARQVGPGSCRINGNPLRVCYTTSAPAVDPNRQYVYSYGLDGYVHKYAVGTGTEARGSGWPQLATSKPFDEKGSSDLTVATARSGKTYLYVANGGYPGDGGNYQGHVTTIDLATGTQRVYNTQCSDQTVHFGSGTAPNCPTVQSAVWSRPGVVYDADTDRIYLVTGNGDYAPAAHNYGDTVLALHPDGTGLSGGAPVDSYTPTDYQQLEDVDADLGSTAPAVLQAPAGSAVARLGVQSGKDATLRLLDLADLSGQHGPNHTGGELQKIPVPQGGGVLTQPTTWRNPADGTSWVFVSNGRGMSALRVQLNGITPSLVPQWQTATAGTTPVIANGVLYQLSPTGLRAVNPTTGAQLWTDGASTGVHWQSPVVANGYVYYPDGSGNLNAYAAPTGSGLASTTTVGATANAGVGVAGVVLFATVAPSAARGTVAFTDGGTPIPGCVARPVNADSASFGYATCVTTFGVAGPHTITATYGGDASYAGSAGSTTVAVTATPDFFQLAFGFLIEFAHNFHLLGL